MQWLTGCSCKVAVCWWGLLTLLLTVITWRCEILPVYFGSKTWLLVCLAIRLHNSVYYNTANSFVRGWLAWTLAHRESELWKLLSFFLVAIPSSGPGLSDQTFFKPWKSGHVSEVVVFERWICCGPGFIFFCFWYGYVWEWGWKIRENKN